MKPIRLALIFVLAWVGPGLGRATASTVPRLTKNQDQFFVENDFVYSRLLKLARDGTYQQINRDRSVAAEVDRGTWEQDSDGTLLLHYTRDGLRFRALLSGPLAITLDPAQKVDDLATAASAIRRWLAQSSDTAFATGSLREISTAPVAITFDPKAESFRREELESLARQIDNFVWSELHQTYRLSPYKPGKLPLLLIPCDATYQIADLPRVQTEYRVLPGQRPPFYFVQVNAETFAREAGNWQKLR